MSAEDVGGWIIWGAVFQVPVFLIANGNWIILALVNVVAVAALVAWSLWVSARLERGSTPLSPVVVKTPRALAPVPPLADGVFVIDAEQAKEAS